MSSKILDDMCDVIRKAGHPIVPLSIEK